MALDTRMLSSDCFLLIGPKRAAGHLWLCRGDVGNGALLLVGIFGKVHVMAGVGLIVRYSQKSKNGISIYLGFVYDILLIGRSEFRQESLDSVSDGLERMFQLL